MKMGNPGALAGATGAKKSIPATAEDLFLIPQDKAKRHNSSAPLEVALCGKSAAHAMVKWRTKSAVSAVGDPGSENFTPRKINVETITLPHTDSFRENQRLQILRLIVAANGKEVWATKLQILYLRQVRSLRETQTNSLDSSILESEQ